MAPRPPIGFLVSEAFPDWTGVLSFAATGAGASTTFFYYMIGVGLSSVKKSASMTSRIAKIKAQNQISSLVNKSEITSSSVLKMGESDVNDNIDYFQNYSEEISTNLFGFISGMQTLTAFKSSDKSTLIYVLFQEL